MLKKGHVHQAAYLLLSSACGKGELSACDDAVALVDQGWIWPDVAALRRLFSKACALSPQRQNEKQSFEEYLQKIPRRCAPGAPTVPVGVLAGVLVGGVAVVAAGNVLASVDAQGSVPFSADELFNACIIGSSCNQLSPGVQDCFEDYLTRGMGGDGVLSCIAKTRSCKDWRACVPGWRSKGAPCNAGDFQVVCLAQDVFLVCIGETGYYVGCQKAFGAQCGAKGLTTGCTAGATCSVPNAKSCKGDVVVQCEDGQEFLFETPCSFNGAICKGGKCIFADGACSQSECQGNVASFCFEGNARKIDCSTLGPGFTCSQTSTGARCIQGAECDPSTHQESCEGDKLLTCFGGRTVRADCMALGFKGCDPTLRKCAP